MKITCIRNCQVITDSGFKYTNVYVQKEKIKMITPDEYKDNEVSLFIDGKGKILIPGMIDQHTHIRDPGGLEHENFVTGTSAAAVGGVTTLLEMPISDVPVTSAKQLLKRKSLASGSAYIDYGFYGGVGFDSIGNIQELIDAGAVGFKTFMCKPDRGRELELKGLWTESDDDLRLVFKAVAKTGLPLAVHAEDGFVIRRLLRKGYVGTDSRPPEAEISAVKRASLIAEETSVRLIFCHLSTAEAINIAFAAKKRGADIYIECTPHHLFLSHSDIKGVEGYAKVKPPIRSKKEVENIWQLIDKDYVDVIASDHAPYSIEKKKQSVDKAPYGIPGLELSLRLMIDTVLQNKMSWQKLLRLVSSNPAKIFNIKSKGVIAEGMDADLLLVNPKGRHIIDVNKMKSKSGGSALMYHGRDLLGDIDLVMLRGNIIMQAGELMENKKLGKEVKR